eukprot:3947888-Lingulodinium_polyedra.AAC.1
MARRSEGPDLLLLPVAERPAQLPRPFVKVGPGHAVRVQERLRVGLQELMPEDHVHHHAGK